MSDAVESLEQHQHAGHIAHGHEGLSRSAQWTALLVAFVAAGLAISEQGARHAELRVQQRAIDATDAWSQYQAKSTRGTITKDLAAIASVMDVGSDPAAADRRNALLARFRAEQDAFEHDPTDGKEAIAKRAQRFEHERDHSTEQAHAYHNGSASYQLGIVLATASAIMQSRPLVYLAIGLAAAGIVFSLLGYLAPEYGAI